MISKKEFIASVSTKADRRDKYLPRILKSIAKLKKTNFAVKKKTEDFVYITICRKDAFDMVRYSIHSFYKHCDFLPKKIIIVSDGSWVEKEGSEYFSKYNLDLCFDNWRNCADYHKDNGQIHLYEWAKKHIWGKKMAAILKYSEAGATLFADPDVLWFKTPFYDEIRKSDFKLKISIDNSHNYDEVLVNKLNLSSLYNLPPINCGIVLAKGNLLECSSEAIRDAISLEAQTPGKFAEQTIFAMMIREFGETWDENQISAGIDDILSPILVRSSYSPDLIARHYVWLMRWLFWKDILFDSF
jgi:hypothetical protein